MVCLQLYWQQRPVLCCGNCVKMRSAANICSDYSSAVCVIFCSVAGPQYQPSPVQFILRDKCLFITKLMVFYASEFWTRDGAARGVPCTLLILEYVALIFSTDLIPLTFLAVLWEYISRACFAMKIFSTVTSPAPACAYIEQNWVSLR